MYKGRQREKQSIKKGGTTWGFLFAASAFLFNFCLCFLQSLLDQPTNQSTSQSINQPTNERAKRNKT